MQIRHSRSHEVPVDQRFDQTLTHRQVSKFRNGEKACVDGIVRGHHCVIPTHHTDEVSDHVVITRWGLTNHRPDFPLDTNGETRFLADLAHHALFGGLPRLLPPAR